MECGSYRGIKLLEHAMKVVEGIFKNRIQQQIQGAAKKYPSPYKNLIIFKII